MQSSFTTTATKDEKQLDEGTNEIQFVDELSPEEKAIIMGLPKAFHKYCITPAKSAKLFNTDDELLSNSADYDLDKKTGIRCATYAKTTWWKSLFSYIPIIGWIFATRVTVRAGSLALIVNRGTPEFLGQGYHVLLDPWSEYKETVSLRDTHDRIAHGTAQIIIVPKGQVACVLDKRTGKYYFLTQGTHTFDSAAVEYKRHIKDISAKDIQIDQLRFLKVTEGNVGVTADAQGKTKVYEHGMHEIPSEEKYPVDLSVKNRVIENLAKNTETGDNFNVEVRATAYYRITNAADAITKVGYIDNIEKMIMDKAQSALGTMVRTLPINELGQAHPYKFYHEKYSTSPMLGPVMSGSNEEKEASKSCSSSEYSSSSSEAEGEPPTYSMFMADYIMEELNKNYFHALGIEITSLAVDSVLPANSATQARLDTLSQQKAITKQNAEMADSQASTSKKAAASKQETDMINAQTEKSKKAMEAEAEASRIERLATAEATKRTMLAEAEAKNIKMVAEAEAAAGKMLEKSPVAADLRRLGMVTRAVNQASTIYTQDASVANMYALFGANRNRSGEVKQLPRSNSTPDLAALTRASAL